MSKYPPPPPIPARVVDPVAVAAESGVEKPSSRFPYVPAQWPKGVSGNPKGRPKSSTEMKQRAAASTDVAMEALEISAQMALLQLKRAYDTLRDPTATKEEKLAASAVMPIAEGMKSMHALLDRGHGKPQQKVEIDLNSTFEEMTEDELDNFIVTVGAEVTKEMVDRKAKK